MLIIMDGGGIQLMRNSNFASIACLFYHRCFMTLQASKRLGLDERR
jgi:hypothetical protein